MDRTSPPSSSPGRHATQTAQKPHTELAPDGGPLNAPVQTFMQPQSGCLGCHKMATADGGAPAGFGFLPGEAQ